MRPQKARSAAAPNACDASDFDQLPGRSRPGGKGKTEAHTFAPKVFRVSRLAEFASVTELIRQTGQPVANWPQVIAKELTDNGIDAAEKAGTAPEIEIVVRDNAITVTDRGPGIKPDVVASLVDYRFTTSSNAAYVSPTRGQQGNALQSILPMGFALAQGAYDVSDAVVTIESRGVAHRISFNSHMTLDMGWRADSPDDHYRCGDDRPRLDQVAAELPRRGQSSPTPRAVFYRSLRNTHGSPSGASGAHRHTSAGTALIADAADRRVACPTVRDFIGLFRGLSGIEKARDISAALGVDERETLADFARRHGAAAASRLLTPMRARSRPVKPRDLGVIGRDHLLTRFADHVAMSERTAQLYMRLAKNRGEIEATKSATAIADLTLNEAAALLMLSSDVRKLLAFAKQTDGLSGEGLTDDDIETSQQGETK